MWPNFFAELVRNNALVCHVEVFSDAVTIDSVPPALADVYRNHKVFGWELDLWKTVERISIRRSPVASRGRSTSTPATST